MFQKGGTHHQPNLRTPQASFGLLRVTASNQPRPPTPVSHQICELITKQFQSLTRSLTPPTPPSSLDDLTTIALALRDRVDLASSQLFRLVGVGLSNLQSDDEEPSPLFEPTPPDAAFDAPTL